MASPTPRRFRPFSTRAVSWSVIALLIGRVSWIYLSGAALTGEVSATPRRPLGTGVALNSETEALLQAIALSDAGRYQESADAITVLLRKHPSGMGFNALGVAQFHLGRLDEALKDFDSAVKADPKSADAYGNRADLRFQRGDLAGALADYDQVVALRPAAPGELSYALYNRAQVRIRSGKDSQAAIKDIHLALESAPTDWSDRARAEQDLFKLKRGESAQETTR